MGFSVDEAPIVGENHEILASVGEVSDGASTGNEPVPSPQGDAAQPTEAKQPTSTASALGLPASPNQSPKTEPLTSPRWTAQTTETLMALGAHKRDPITNEHWFFADPGDKNEWSAQHYDTLARRHFISFQGIYEMIVAVLQDYYDVGAELEAMDEEAKRDDQLLKLKLPLHEALQIWCRSREGLLRFAELFPEHREKIERFLAEREAVMIAMLA